MPTNSSENKINPLNPLISKLLEFRTTFEHKGHSGAPKEIVRLIREITGIHTCTLTFVDLEQERASQVAVSSEDPSFVELLEKQREVRLGKMVNYEIAERGLPYETHQLQFDGGGVALPQTMREYGLQSFYCYPIKNDGVLKGYINLFSKTKAPFSDQIKIAITVISKFAEMLIYQHEVKKYHNKDLKSAIEEMARVSGDDRRDQIMRITLKYARKLLGKDHFADILKLNDNTGDLEVLEAIPKTTQSIIEYDKGFCSKALISGKYVISDIYSPDWNNLFIDMWSKSSKSEMVIPLTIENEQIRRGTRKESAFRPIGVLNFESPYSNAFTEEDADILLPLVSQASLLIEKLATEKKLSMLRNVERKLLGKDLEDSLHIIANGIRDTLGFELINISLVDYQRNLISTVEVVGLDEESKQKFLEMASHRLDSHDIQASVVRKKLIEVPEENDPRFDKKIWKEFGQDNLTRVFVPIIYSMTNKCVGTIDAGFKKGHRKFIYESDVQILQGFVELASEAINRSQLNLVDKVFHELQSPIAGIVGHTDVLRHMYERMSHRDISTKFDDIDLDCEILRRNIEEMKYFLGRPSAPLVIEEVRVMRDIVIKTVNQLKNLMLDSNLNPDNVKYDHADVSKIAIYADRVKLNQVIYNLLMNSIRYAEKTPNTFRMDILAGEEERFFIIKFRDWGIGIKEEYREKIFTDYFRTPEAAKHTKGTGLGLPISRKIMRDIGGDVILVSPAKPTEFQVKIPKRYQAKPQGFNRR